MCCLMNVIESEQHSLDSVIVSDLERFHGASQKLEQLRKQTANRVVVSAASLQRFKHLIKLSNDCSHVAVIALRFFLHGISKHASNRTRKFANQRIVFDLGEFFGRKIENKMNIVD